MKNISKISLTAIILWAVTIFAFGYRFITGSTVKMDDNRQAITLTADEKTLVLSEMRGMLGSIQGIVDGLDQNSMLDVQKAATDSGTLHMVDTDPRLMMKLPLEFKKMGVGVHKYFDKIASAAKDGAKEDQIVSMLSTQLKTCVACHATYQFKVK